MIGEELGRGAYGNVFKGIDSQNGSTVAIKQISLNGTSTDNLQSVMGEIDLLKTLNHKNIVKYLGSFKTRRYSTDPQMRIESMAQALCFLSLSHACYVLSPQSSVHHP